MTIGEKASLSAAGLAADTARRHRLRWWVLAVLATAQLMVVLDATIVNIALPDAQKALGFGNEDRQWVVTAYALAFGSLLLLGGRLSDLFGRRRAFNIGLVGFAVMSALGGAAGNFELLVVARAGQGVFGALLAPAALSLLTTTFSDPAERGRAFGIFGAIAGGAGALGLLLGGALTEWLSWRWCMFVNVAIAAIALLGSILLLKEDEPADKKKLDIPGTVAIVAGLFAIVYGFSNAESNGWGDWATITWLLIGLVLTAVFVYLQTVTTHALLPMRVLLDRIRGGSFIAIFTSGVGMFGIFLFLTYYMQQSLGYTPIKTGFAFLPLVVALAIAATVSTSVLLPRFGPRWIVSISMLLGAIGLIPLTQLDVNSSYWVGMLPGLIVVGIGIGGTFAPAVQGAVSGVADEDAGVASAAVNTVQQVGGSIGTALLSTLAASSLTNYLTDRPHTPGVLNDAAIHSYTVAFTGSAVIFAIGAVLTALVYKSGKVEMPAEGVVVA